MYTTWQIGRLPVPVTWLGLVTQSVISGSVWSTGQTGNNLVINRWLRCLLPSGPSLALPHTNSWLKIHIVLLEKIISYTVVQLSTFSLACLKKIVVV